MKSFPLTIIACVSLSTAVAAITSTPASAESVTWSLSGNLISVTDTNGVLSANNPALGIGSPFSLNWTYNNSIGSTFQSTYAPNSGSASWWGTGHSSMTLRIGSSIWQTVGPERVDAIFTNIPAQISWYGGPRQQIDSNYRNGAIATNVSPGYGVVGGTYDMTWILANGISDVTFPPGFQDYLNFTFNPGSTTNEPSLTPTDFPSVLNLSNWDTGRINLRASEQGSNGQSTYYDLVGNITGGEIVGQISSTPLPAAWTMMLIGLGGFGFVAHRRKKRAVSQATA